MEEIKLTGAAKRAVRLERKRAMAKRFPESKIGNYGRNDGVSIELEAGCSESLRVNWRHSGGKWDFQWIYPSTEELAELIAALAARLNGRIEEVNQHVSVASGLMDKANPLSVAPIAEEA